MRKYTKNTAMPGYFLIIAGTAMIPSEYVQLVAALVLITCGFIHILSQ